MLSYFLPGARQCAQYAIGRGDGLLLSGHAMYAQGPGVALRDLRACLHGR